MSGGYFEYQQLRIEDIATMIDELVASNDDNSVNEYGDKRGRGYTPETIARFRDAAHYLRVAAAMTQRIDWLVSGDDDEESFHRRWAEEMAKFES